MVVIQSPSVLAQVVLVHRLKLFFGGYFEYHYIWTV